MSVKIIDFSKNQKKITKKKLKQAEEDMEKSLEKLKDVIIKDRMGAFIIVDELMGIIQAAKYISHSEVRRDYE